MSELTFEQAQILALQKEVDRLNVEIINLELKLHQCEQR